MRYITVPAINNTNSSIFIYFDSPCIFSKWHALQLHFTLPHYFINLLKMCTFQPGFISFGSKFHI